MIRNSIAGAVSSLVARPVNGAKLNFETVMKKLFANGEQGFFYDPNDLTTLYQDAAGTVPVTAAGQPVGLILDKSGRNNHAFQTTSASRPILRKNAVTGSNYLEFDGSDDFLQTNNIDFTATDKVSLFAGVANFGSATGSVIETGLSYVNPTGGFALRAGHPLSLNNLSLHASAGGDAVSSERFDVTTPSVFSGFVDLSRSTADSQLQARSNGNTVSMNRTGLAKNEKFASVPVYIGRRNGNLLPFNGHIYGLVGIGRLTTDNETVDIEKELAKRTGVTLSV